MHPSRKLGLAALFASVLSACGGGGGGDGATTPAAAADPLAIGTAAPPSAGSGTSTPNSTATPIASGPGGTTATPPAPASPPTASFSAFDPVRVASSVAATTPATARLSTGGNVVVWSTDGGRAVWAQTTTAAGVLVGSPIAVNAPNTQLVPAFSVAATADGGFIVAYVISDSAPSTQFAAVQGIQVRRYGADGTLVNDTRANDQAPNFGSDGHLYSVNAELVIKALPNGGFVLGWTGKVALVAPNWGFLQRLAADGSRAGPMVVIGGGSPDFTQLIPTALPDGTVVAVWQQQDFAPSGSTYLISTQHFGTDSTPLSAPAALAGTSGSARFPIGAAALSNGDVAVAWADANDGSGTAHIHSALLAPNGAPTAPVTTTDWTSTSPASVSRVAAIPLASGFGVLWQLSNSNYRMGNAKLYVQRHDAGGAASEVPSLLVDRTTWWVSATTGAGANAGEGFTAAGGADGHFTAIYGQADPDQANAYLVGR